MGTFANSEDPDEMQDNAASATALFAKIQTTLEGQKHTIIKKILVLTPKSAKWTLWENPSEYKGLIKADNIFILIYTD